jgi:hypothetical protein
MEIADIKKNIEKLQIETQAMRNDPLLQEEYAKKILQLVKLRRSLIRKGKKNR